MGLNYNNNVEEMEIMRAYGLTVYGKLNRYDWMIFPDRKPENVLISIKIVDDTENVIFSENLGNNCIFQSIMDNTLDNFLYWIQTENPRKIEIEDRMYTSLCAYDSLFNHQMENKKMKARQEEAERKRAEEHAKLDREQTEKITVYCDQNGLLSCYCDGTEYIIKPHAEGARRLLGGAKPEALRGYIDFMRAHPDNKDCAIVASGNRNEILAYIDERKI